VNQRLKKPLAVPSGVAALGSVVAGGTAMANSFTAKPAVQHTKILLSTGSKTTTPIKHVVVIFDENVSFDHYFGTYPNAQNPAGEPKFTAEPNTPSVNGLTQALLENNPNGVNPQRLGPNEAVTADMDHDYTDEQKAMDGGLMDKFVPFGGRNNDTVMDYYDGNTVTTLWNYARIWTHTMTRHRRGRPSHSPVQTSGIYSIKKM
jgi:phospholipase C